MALWPVSPLDSFMVDPVGRVMRDIDRTLMPYWRNADHSVLHVGNTTKEFVNDDKKFAVSLDVSHFKPEEIKVQLEGNELIIEGNQEVKGENSYIKKYAKFRLHLLWYGSDPSYVFLRSFMHKWALPEDCDVDAIHTQLNDAGHLSIEAPKTGQHPRRRNIPIMAAPKKKH
ncbi:Hsp20/alpha crystallin family protein [Dictyocaulus viviparus]|uniref:Hsp20/alpha crystallin family protein n=1 Tax=Dictyocaulus viviparus TaxID=29172 RepID=A0A0D8XYK3_DICVI|nr:Hsp20/alpha crystallin family protein [Dictyocaulus viviparus]